MIIKKIDETNEKVGEFINKAFTDYAIKCCVELNFEEYCFVAEEDGEVVGAITGRAYYNEVHIGDLIIDEKYRRLKVGSKLVKAVEEAYAGKGYNKITLTTFNSIISKCLVNKFSNFFICFINLFNNHLSSPFDKKI